MSGHACASPVLPMLAREFGANATEIGATMSAFAAGTVAVQPAVRMVRRRGRAHGR